MLGILGSGFGLYGYLPAAVSLGLTPIILPLRYQEKLLARQELRDFTKHIHWVDSEQTLIEMATTLVVSRRPIDQFEALPNYLTQVQLKKLILEKPLASNPAQALQMLQSIKISGKQCNVGFTFRFTPWAILLRNQLAGFFNVDQEIWHLKWHFLAHHFTTGLASWKRENSEGGGALRFYGIHIIALLAEWGYKYVISSEIVHTSDAEYSSWRAVLSGPGLPQFKVDLDTSSSINCFVITRDSQANIFYEGVGPFDDTLGKSMFGVDSRSKFLKEVLSEVIAPNQFWPTRILDTINLWELVESN
jgi:hypothetical protein